MNNVESLKDTITPKSDQLNTDDLITGPITVQVKAVTRGTADQPVVISISGGYQPYKPCKSMRRVLIALWGDNGLAWAGKWLTLYADPAVRFGGVQVGGIRISHVSDIKTPVVLMLTTTRSKRAEYHVSPLVQTQNAAKSQGEQQPNAGNEAELLIGLQKAAESGMDSLMKAFSELPKSPSKAGVWKQHGEALKATAEEADKFDIVTIYKQAIDACNTVESLDDLHCDFEEDEKSNEFPEKRKEISQYFLSKKEAIKAEQM